MKWQPIETAPKPGCLDPQEPILVVVYETRVDLASWDDKKRTWKSETNHDGFEHEEFNPTLWMPLPHPPTK